MPADERQKRLEEGARDADHLAPRETTTLGVEVQDVAKAATDVESSPVIAMINGVHAVLFTRDADGLRAFLRDVLGFSSVDAGGGWLIFALPPAELGVHRGAHPQPRV